MFTKFDNFYEMMINATTIFTKEVTKFINSAQMILNTAVQNTFFFTLCIRHTRSKDAIHTATM